VTRVGILGAGAIGTYLGVCLAQGGVEVGVIARPQTADQVERHGLRLTRAGATSIVRPAWIATSLVEGLAHRPDLLIVATKAYDVDPIAAQWPAAGSAATAVLTIQNGIGAEQPLVALLGRDRVLTGTVTTAVSVRGPGDAVVERERGVGLAADLTRRYPELPGAWRRQGVGVADYADPAAMKWSKLLTNLVGNATSALVNWRVDAIYRHRGLAALEQALLRECLQVMARRGTPVVDLPGTPVRALAALVRLPGWLALPLLRPVVASGRGDKMPSFHIDWWSGRGRTEAPWLHGAVAAEGRGLGVATPVCARLTRLLATADPHAYSPEALITEVNRL
jgi:2-dehydropantoate 2-reductase